MSSALTSAGGSGALSHYVPTSAAITSADIASTRIVECFRSTVGRAALACLEDRSVKTNTAVLLKISLITCQLVSGDTKGLLSNSFQEIVIKITKCEEGKKVEAKFGSYVEDAHLKPFSPDSKTNTIDVESLMVNCRDFMGNPKLLDAEKDAPLPTEILKKFLKMFPVINIPVSERVRSICFEVLAHHPSSGYTCTNITSQNSGYLNFTELQTQGSFHSSIFINTPGPRSIFDGRSLRPDEEWTQTEYFLRAKVRPPYVSADAKEETLSLPPEKLLTFTNESSTKRVTE